MSGFGTLIGSDDTPTIESSLVHMATGGLIRVSNMLLCMNTEPWLQSRTMESTRMELEPGAQRVALCFEETLPVGDAKLHIEFTGSLNDKLAGLYRSKYTVSVQCRLYPGEAPRRHAEGSSV